MAAPVKTATDRAIAAWGTPTPDWVLALAKACDATSQAAVSKRLSHTNSSVINQVLGNSYKGRVDRVEQRVRGELMHETVRCPVLGEISKRECLDNQKRGYAATNPTRVKLSKACPACPNREDACSKE